MVKGGFGVCHVSEDSKVESIEFYILGGCEGFGLYCVEDDSSEDLAVNCEFPIFWYIFVLKERAGKFKARI